MKKFISGILVGTILATAIGSFASGFWDNIDVLRNDIRVVVNNKEVPANNFLYNDTTYLPLRAISNALDVPVRYDETTNTAFIGEGALLIPEYNGEYEIPVATVQEDFLCTEKSVDGIMLVITGGKHCVNIPAIERKLEEMGYGTKYVFIGNELKDWSKSPSEVIFENVPIIKNLYIPLEYYYGVLLPWMKSL